MTGAVPYSGSRVEGVPRALCMGGMWKPVQLALCDPA